MADIGADVQSLEFSRYAAVLRRRWRMIVVGILSGLLLGGAYLLIAPREVSATTIVNINVITDSMFGGDRAPSTLVDPQTEQQLGRSTRVLSDAIETLGSDHRVAYMRERTSVAPVAASTVVKISYRAPTAKEAIATADAIAQSYLDFRQGEAQGRVDQNVEALTTRRDKLREDLIKAKTTLASAKEGSAAAVQAASDADLITAELNALISRMNDFDRVDTLGGVVISDAADTPTTYSPSRKLALGSGVLVGLLGGIVLAFIVQGMDRRVFDRAAVTRAGGGLVLAELRGREGVIPAVGADGEDIRALCDQLLSVYPPDLVLAVLDLTSDHRSSDIGVNIADGFAEIGRIVHLILPGHDPAFTDHVRERLGLGIAEAEGGSTVARSTKRPRLHVSIISADGADPASDERGFAALVKAVPGAVAVIVLPPDPPRSWRLAAARASHTTLLVAALRGTRHAEIVSVASDLWAVDARVYGTVLVHASRRITALSGSWQGPGRVAPEQRPLGRAPAAPVRRGSGTIDEASPVVDEPVDEAVDEVTADVEVEASTSESV